MESIEAGRRMEKNLLRDEFGYCAPEFDEETSKQVWQELKESGVVEDSDPYYPLNPIDVSHKNIQDTTRALTSQRHNLLDCLRKKKNPPRTFGNDIRSSMNWFSKNPKLLFHWPNSPMRFLAGRRAKHIGAGPALTPAPSPSLSPRRAMRPLAYARLGPHPTPAKSPSSNLQPRAEAASLPSPPPDVTISPEPSVKDLPSPTPHVAPHSLPKKSKFDKKEIIIGASIGGTVVLVALLLFCFLKARNNRVGPRHELKDESPLMMVTLSDFSAASSRKSFRFNTSRKNSRTSSKRFGKAPTSMASSADDHSLAKAPLSEDSADGPSNAPMATALRPPPGRAVPPAPVPAPPPPPAPKAPPPPKIARPPPLPPKIKLDKSKAQSEDDDLEPGTSKAKLKPFFWDKVAAKPDQTMVWHEINAGSFQFSEEKIESLFGYPAGKNKIERKKDAPSFEPIQYIQLIDSKKAQNLSILLRALNVTTQEVCDALREGDELPTELLQTMLKMAPTTEEELKIRLFSGELSQLGPAERFLKAISEIPFVFKRIESLHFMSSFQDDVTSLKESYAILEVASEVLRNSRLFLKLLEAVLKTGNRMNDGTFRGGAQAFKLDTLLKLSDVKGVDGKTTLVHFVVQEIIRSEGRRAARNDRESQSRSQSQSVSSLNVEDHTTSDCVNESEDHYSQLGLQVVSGLSSELENVRKASAIDVEGLNATLTKLGTSLLKARDFLESETDSIVEENHGFHRKLAEFVGKAEAEVSSLQEEDQRILALVKSTAEYFHGNARKDEGLRLFMIVRDFLIILDKVCKEVKNSMAEASPMKAPKKEPAATASSPSFEAQPPTTQRLFPAILEQRVDYSSSDDDTQS